MVSPLLEEMQRQWAQQCLETQRRFFEEHGDVPAVARTWMDGNVLHYEIRRLVEADED